MKQRPGIHFCLNNASKKYLKRSMQKLIGVEKPIYEICNNVPVRERKLEENLSQIHIIYKCSTRSLLSTSGDQIIPKYTNVCQGDDSSPICRSILKTDQVDTKQIQPVKSSKMRICVINSRPSFNKNSQRRMKKVYKNCNLKKQFQLMSKKINSNITKNKRRIILKSGNNSKPYLSTLYLGKMISHSSKSFQSLRIKEVQNMAIDGTKLEKNKFKKSFDESAVNICKKGEEIFSPKNFTTEIFNSITEHRENLIPKCVYTLQSQSSLYRKGIHIKPTYIFSGTADKTSYDKLFQRNTLEVNHVTENRNAFDYTDHQMQSSWAKHNKSNYGKSIYSDKDCRAAKGRNLGAVTDIIQRNVSHSKCLQADNQMEFGHLLKRCVCSLKLQPIAKRVRRSSLKRKEQGLGLESKIKKVTVVHSEIKSKQEVSSTISFNEDIYRIGELEEKTYVIDKKYNLTDDKNKKENIKKKNIQSSDPLYLRSIYAPNKKIKIPLTSAISSSLNSNITEFTHYRESKHVLKLHTVKKIGELPFQDRINTPLNNQMKSDIQFYLDSKKNNSISKNYDIDHNYNLLMLNKKLKDTIRDKLRMPRCLETVDTYNKNDCTLNFGQIFKRYISKFSLQMYKTSSSDAKHRVLHSNTPREIQDIKVRPMNRYKKGNIDLVAINTLEHKKVQKNVKHPFGKTIVLEKNPTKVDIKMNNSKLNTKQLKRKTSGIIYKEIALNINSYNNFGQGYENIRKSNNFLSLRPKIEFYRNIDSKIVKTPFFQTFYAFNAKVPHKPNIYNKSAHESYGQLSGLNNTYKYNLLKRRYSRRKALKLTGTNIPRSRRFTSFPKSKSSPEPKNAILISENISSMKSKHNSKSKDNTPSQKNIRSYFDFNTEILKEKLKNRRSPKQLPLSECISTTKKKNRLTMGGIRGIYLQYKGTKVKKKNSPTQPNVLKTRGKALKADREKKSKNKSFEGTKDKELFSVTVFNERKRLKKRQLKSDNKYHNKSGNFYNVTPKKIKINHRRTYSDFFKHNYLPNKGRFENKRVMLTYNTQLDDVSKKNKKDFTVKPNNRNIKIKTKIGDTNDDVMEKSKSVRFSPYRNDDDSQNLSPYKNSYTKTPLLKKYFYAMGLQTKRQHSNHKVQVDDINIERSIIINDLYADQTDTKKEKDNHKVRPKSEKKNRQEPAVDNPKHITKITNELHTMHDIKSPNFSYMKNPKERYQEFNVSKTYIKRPLERYRTEYLLETHNQKDSASHQKSIQVEVKPKIRNVTTKYDFTMLKRHKTNSEKNNLKNDHGDGHPPCNPHKGKNKSKKIRNIEMKTEKLNNDQGKTRNHDKKQRGKDLSTGDNNIYDKSVHNPPARVKKKLNIFSGYKQSQIYDKKKESSDSPTRSNSENNSIISKCINKLGLKQNCKQARISSTSTEPTPTCSKNRKYKPIAQLKIKDDATSKTLQTPRKNNKPMASMPKTKLEANLKRTEDVAKINSDLKHQENSDSMDNVTIESFTPEAKEKTSKKKKKSSKQKKKDTPITIETVNDETPTETSLSDTNKEKKKKKSSKKTKKGTPITIETISDETPSETSLSDTKKDVIPPKFKQNRITKLPNRENPSVVSTTEKLNKGIIKSNLKQNNKLAKYRSDNAWEISTFRTHMGRRKKSTKFSLKSTIFSVLNKIKKRIRSTKVKPITQTTQSRDKSSDSIVSTLKKVRFPEGRYKKPNAATKAALNELQADDPALPHSARDPVLKLIVDKNTMNVLNRDEIVYGLGTRRNESGAVKQGRLALQRKLIPPPAIDLVINKDDAKIVSATPGEKKIKSIQKNNLLKKHDNIKKKNLPCIFQCPECLRARGPQTDEVPTGHKTAAMVKTERVLDSVSNALLGWAGKAPCICGTPICRRERERMKRDIKKQKIKVKPCTCGSFECELAMSRKYHRAKIKHGKRKYKALKQKRIEKQKEKEKYQLQHNMAREKDKIKSIDKQELDKRYAREDALAKKKKKKKQLDALKRIDQFKNANDCFLMAESVIDIGKLGVSVVFGLIRSSIRAIVNVKDTMTNIRDFARDPHRMLRRMVDSCKVSEASGIARRIKHRGRVMKTVQFFKTAMESNPITNYILYIRNPQRRLKKIKRQADPLDYNCSLYMGSLRKRPCLWVYFLCPWFYPHCVSLVGIWRQFTDVLLFVLAVGIWSPCILCMELCRACMCCFLCSG